MPADDRLDRAFGQFGARFAAIFGERGSLGAHFAQGVVHRDERKHLF